MLFAAATYVGGPLVVVARIFYGMLWAISTYVIVFYGDGNFSNLPDVTGNFDVGVKSIWSSRD